MDSIENLERKFRAINRDRLKANVATSEEWVRRQKDLLQRWTKLGSESLVKRAEETLARAEKKLAADKRALKKHKEDGKLVH